MPIPPTIKQRIVDDLLAAIRRGELRPGQAVPSARELRERYGASITPVRQAIENLQARGVLVGQPGRAVFVADPLPEWISTEIITDGSQQSHSSDDHET